MSTKKKQNFFYAKNYELSNIYDTIVVIARKNIFNVRIHSLLTILSSLKIACFTKI